MTTETRPRRLLRRVLFAWNLTNAVVWASLMWPSLTVWRDSVPWLVFMSVYANFAAGLAAFTASLAHREQTTQ